MLSLVSRLRLFTACLIACGISLNGQAPIPIRSSDHNYWLGPNRVLFVPATMRTIHGPAVLDTQGERRRLPWPPRKEGRSESAMAFSEGIQVASGNIYYIHKLVIDHPQEAKKKPLRSLRLELFRFDLQRWRWETDPSGVLEWPKGMKPILLSSDRILGIGTTAGSFEHERMDYPFAIFRSNDSGVFKLDHVLDTGLEKPCFQADGSWTYPWMSSLWIKVRTASVGEYTFVGTGFGLFWVFDQKGTLRRQMRVFKNLTEENLQKGLLWDEAILGLQPKSDASLLISTLDEDALARGFLLWKQKGEAPSGKEYLPHQKQWVDALLQTVPRIDWYVLDPLQGSVREELPPRGLPDAIRSTSELERFNWSFRSDGNLLLYSEEERQKMDPSAPKSAVEQLLSKPKN